MNYPQLDISNFDIPVEWTSDHKNLLKNIFKYVVAEGYKPFEFTIELFNSFKDADWIKFMFNLDKHLYFEVKKS